MGIDKYLDQLMAIDKYLDLVASQHKTKPNFISWLSKPLMIIEDNITVTNSIPSSFDVDNAVGVQLDVIGNLVGRSRILGFQPADGSPPKLDDDNYRVALKAKIALNQWDGTIPQINDIWASLFPSDITLNIVDNQDMTMSALVGGQVSTIVTEMVTAGYIIPKPTGVKLTIIENTDIAEKQYTGTLVSGMDYITITAIIG